MKKLYIAMLSVLAAFQASANLIPSGKGPLYYEIGGGEDIPLPAYFETTRVPLSADGNVGLGYNCGAFNPELSLVNSLNGAKARFQEMQQHILSNAQAAIAEMPMYALARANPSLYNLMNNGFFSARQDLQESTKTCEVMQNEIAHGKNPYTDWGTISLGENWKYHMSLASSSLMMADSNNQDINAVKTDIEKDNGEFGVPWVKGISRAGLSGNYAGGKGQPVIYVIKDTSIAGFNALLQSHRALDDTSAPARTDKNQRLVDTFKSPLDAASWITSVVGEQGVTTYPNGPKESTPGVGLLSEQQALSQDMLGKLTRLVTGQDEPNLTNLKAASAPHVMMSEAVLETVRNNSPVMREIILRKLAQQIAAANIIDKSQLALQLLEVGRQVPAIYGNEPAQRIIQAAIERLRQAIQDFQFNLKVNQEFVSNTVKTMMQATNAETHRNTAITPSQKTERMLDQGAIKKEEG